MEKKKEKKESKKRMLVASIIVIGIVLLGMLFFLMQEKEVVIEEVTDFSYFRIFEDGKYGVINTRGEQIIEPIYEMVWIPNPSKAVFICYEQYSQEENQQKTKVYNDKKEEIFAQYEQVLPLAFKEKITEVPFEKSVLKYKENGKYGLIDFKGNKITKSIYDAIESLLYKEGYLIVKQEGKYGIIDSNGKQIIECMYDTITADQYYNEQTKYKEAGFIVGMKTQEGYRYGYCNKKGEKYLDTEYNALNRVTEIQDNKNSYIIAFKKGQAGLYKNKEQLLKHEYEEIEYNVNNALFLVQKNAKQGIVDKEAKQILPIEYEVVRFAGKYMNAIKGGNTQIFDEQGNIVDTPYISLISTENENFFITVDKDEKYGVVNNKKEVIIKNNYSYIEYAFGEYFIATNEGKMGILNKEGKSEINFEYQIIQKLKDTNILQAVGTTDNTMEFYNDKLHLIDKGQNVTMYLKENIVSIVSPTSVKYFNKDGNSISSKEIFKENTLFASCEGGKWGFVDKEDTVKVERKYDMVTEFNKYGFAGVKIDNKWGVINQEQHMVIEPIYDAIDWQNPEFIGKYGKMNLGYGYEYYTSQLVKK